MYTAQESQFLQSMGPSVVQSLLTDRDKGVARALATSQALVAFWHFLTDGERLQLSEPLCERHARMYTHTYTHR